MTETTSQPTEVLPPAPADVLLADGRVAVIRPLHPEDADGLLALHDQASDQSVHLRFFTLNRGAGSAYVQHLVDRTGDTVITLVAVVDGTIVGEATAERLSADSAEVAFLVSDAVHGHGVGSLLLEHLAAACRDRGIDRFVADVMAENSGMLRVFRDAGFTLTKTSELGIVGFDIATEPTARAVSAADDRESQAEARSLRPLLYPEVVALLGVRREGGGIGGAVLDSITRGGFLGRLYVVHPQASEIAGQTCFPSLAALPEAPDLVVLAVPAGHAVAALEEAAAAGARSAVVISSGFGELSEDGSTLQHALVQTAREHSIRLVGPNCLGILANDPKVRLNATFTRATPPSGGLAIASQSGGVGIVMMDLAERLNLGVHAFVSLGNKADVSGNDLLAAWYDDPAVTAAALYLESFGNARKFARVARRFAERKPLLAVVGGRSSGGVRAGQSHTAAAAAPAVGVEALFTQAGVIPCRSAESMARAALLLTEQPLTRGPRVGIVSNAGGVGVLAADAADELGLVVPELSSSLVARLRELITGTIGTSNPIDLGAGADAETCGAAVDALLASGEVDTVLVATVATNVSDPTPLADAVASARAAYPELPVVLVAMGGQHLAPGRLPGVTVFEVPDDAVEALAQAARYAAWLELPHTALDPGDAERARRARGLAQVTLAAAGRQDRWAPPATVDALLAPYGLEVTGEVVTGPEDAAVTAARIGFPVVVKVADERVVHKTDRGLVRVGLRSRREVIAAVRSFGRLLGHDDVPVLVQPVVDGVEIALGVVRDPGFGPLVMVAAGGVATNVWKDQVFLLPPVSTQDAQRALRSLRVRPLLEGYRGSPRVDIDDLVRLVRALGQLVVDVPEIAELDLNPVMATPEGVVVVDAKLRLSVTAPLDEGVPRQLRPRT